MSKNTYLYAPLKKSNMQQDIRDIEIRQFADADKQQLDMILGAMFDNPSKQTLNPSISFAANELIELLGEHRIEHGIAPGGIYLPGDVAIGIGGFHFLQETGVYEIVCNVSPDKEHLVPAILSSLITDAFDNLKMDKICARAIPASPFDMFLAESGFVFLGERMFVNEGDGQIWNYYELEDERNMVSADNSGAYTDNDWDALFY